MDCLKFIHSEGEKETEPTDEKIKDYISAIERFNKIYEGTDYTIKKHITEFLEDDKK